MSLHFHFEWTSSVDAEHPSLTYRLYENGVQVVQDIAATNFDLLMDGKPEGSYSYTVTAFDASITDPSKQESPHSNAVVQALVFPKAPAAPASLSVSIVLS